MKIAARARGLSKTYGTGSAQVFALREVDFEVVAGEFTAIMGPSGSGKSTLMHLLAALDTPSAGSVMLGDIDIATLKDTPLTELRRERVGFIFQSFNLVPTLTAKENILLPLAIAGKKVDQQWFNQIVEVLGLGDRLSHKPAELSGGQQQRVACARALMNRPEVVFGDEPTGNLDSVAATEVLSFLRRSVDEFGQTVVMVTHDAMAASYADRAVFLSDGQIVEEVRGASHTDLLKAMSRLYPRKSGPQPAVPQPAQQPSIQQPEIAELAVPTPEPVQDTEPSPVVPAPQQPSAVVPQAAPTSPNNQIEAMTLSLPDFDDLVIEDPVGSEYGEPVYRDGGAAPSRASAEYDESDLEMTIPRHAILD